MSQLRLVKTIEAVREAVAVSRQGGQTIGFVPTMGALHAGHGSLVRAARRETGFVVVSIFVNPTQFGPNEDLAQYPRTLEDDLRLCAAEGADLVFIPEPDVMYPAGFCTSVEVAGLQDGLCGPSRPGHFRGVASVVLKLFNIVSPDIAYFGQKDAQQARILQQMARDLDLPLTVRICPTLREADGLAMSSRNRYLNPTDRRNATVLFQSLEEARRRIETGERDAAKIQHLLIERIKATPGAVLDYASLVDADTLQAVNPLKGRVLIALAVNLGATRLIDNVLVEV